MTDNTESLPQGYDAQRAKLASKGKDVGVQPVVPEQEPDKAKK